MSKKPGKYCPTVWCTRVCCIKAARCKRCMEYCRLVSQLSSIHSQDYGINMYEETLRIRRRLKVLKSVDFIEPEKGKLVRYY